MKEIIPSESDNNKSEKPENLISSEEVVFVRPTKLMTANEMLEEMKKQGMKPLTLGEMNDLHEKETGVIEPKDTDIIVESEKPKKLLE